MIGGRDVVCLSSIDWHYLWQVHQEVMSRIARAGNRVLYLESTGLRPPSLHDAARLWARVQHARGRAAAPHPTHGVDVWSPVVLPFPYSRVARIVNEHRLAARLRRWIAGRPAPIAWLFLPTPLSLALARSVKPALTVYYCVDDLRHSSAAAQSVAASEDRLLREADVVLVTSHALQERARRFRQDAHLIPAGVDYATFAGPHAMPDDLARIPSPRVGYSGGQPPWLDRTLLRQVAEAMPDVSFVLVGPSDVPELAGLRNVHVLGPRPHALLPAYLQGLDAALIPYAINKYTDAIYPAKLNEYFAAGVPVIATPIRELRMLHAQHGTVVRLARTTVEFAASIREALNADRAAARAAARVLAKRSDWTNKLQQIDSIIERALAARGERVS